MPLSGEPDRWRFQQKQAADRGLPSLVPRGKVQEGEAPSWFPAPAPERIRIIFPATRAAGKILLTERRVGAALAGPAPKRSAIATGGTPGLARGNGSAISTKHYTERSVAARPPLGGLAAAPERSDWPSSQRPKGAETGPSRPNVPRNIWARSFQSAKSLSPSGSSTFRGMTALETLMRWM